MHFVNSLIGVGIYGFFSALGHMNALKETEVQHTLQTYEKVVA